MLEFGRYSKHNLENHPVTSIDIQDHPRSSKASNLPGCWTVLPLFPWPSALPKKLHRAAPDPIGNCTLWDPLGGPIRCTGAWIVSCRVPGNRHDVWPAECPCEPWFLTIFSMVPLGSTVFHSRCFFRFIIYHIYWSRRVIKGVYFGYLRFQWLQLSDNIRATWYQTPPRNSKKI